MKRYMLFMHWEYYPGGGMKDFIATEDSMVELIIRRIKEHKIDPYKIKGHIYDTRLNHIITLDDLETPEPDI